MRHAVIVSATRTAIGKAPNGALRTVRPDEMGAAVIRGGARTGTRPRPLRVDDVILGCAMPEAEQGLNVARIASLRAGVPVIRVGGHHQPLLFVGPAGHRLRRRTGDVRFRRGGRRRRHRVDEPGADGRQQDLAESGTRRIVSGRLSEHRSRRRESCARARDPSERAGCIRAAESPARARGHRRRTDSPTRSHR